VASYDVASNICQALGGGGGGETQQRQQQQQQQQQRYQQQQEYEQQQQEAVAAGGAAGGAAGAADQTPDGKQRLRWTPELHKRFVEAVQRLGGLDLAGWSLTLNPKP
jgi:hypothetical protein